jgi:hypothetical protein
MTARPDPPNGLVPAKMADIGLTGEPVNRFAATGVQRASGERPSRAAGAASTASLAREPGHRWPWTQYESAAGSSLMITLHRAGLRTLLADCRHRRGR